MQFMVLVKASPESEAGVMPTREMLAEMGAFNEELMKAGMFVTAGGLKASTHGARIAFRGGTPHVIDGPFTETKELVAGFWVIEAPSRDEAIRWMSRAPFGDAQIEVRPLHTPEDFGP